MSGLQASHCWAPCPEKVFFGQSVQYDDPSVLYVPSRHSVQLDVYAKPICTKHWYQFLLEEEDLEEEEEDLEEDLEEEDLEEEEADLDEEDEEEDEDEDNEEDHKDNN